MSKSATAGAALDGLLPLHMAQRNLRLGIVGTAGLSYGKVMDENDEHKRP